MIWYILILYYAFQSLSEHQAEFKDYNIYLKDGTLMGKKSELIEECKTSFPADTYDINLGQEEVCECLIYVIADNFTNDEFETLYNSYGDDWLQILLFNGEPGVGDDIEDCIVEFIKNNTNYKDVSEYIGSLFAASLLKEFENNPDLIDIDIDPYGYCTCIKNKIIEYGISFGDLDELEDSNSALFNEIILGCLDNPLSVFIDDNTKSNDVDVFGEVDYEYIDLLINAGVFKVKVSIGGIIKYFILDSGASDVLINADLEDRLLRNGTIKREDYISDGYYTMADGSVIKSRRCIIDGLKVGGFTINNVTIAIADGDFKYLLGKSFLDKFNRWSIDNKKSLLYLERYKHR